MLPKWRKIFTADILKDINLMIINYQKNSQEQAAERWGKLGGALEKRSRRKCRKAVRPWSHFSIGDNSLIMAILPETYGSVIAMQVLVMSLGKFLRDLFAPIFDGLIRFDY